MRDVAVFFCEKISGVDISCHMFDRNVRTCNRFPYCVFSDLNMAESLCSHVGGPKDACIVIVVYGGGFGTEGGE